MTTPGPHDAPVLPGTVKPKRFRPAFQYELLACGVAGHEIVGADARDVRAQDSSFVRPGTGRRWYRCLRCDSWLPLPPPAQPVTDFPPSREDVELPTRGRALRDKVVLRAIAVDRALHFLVLGVLGVIVLLFANDRAQLKDKTYRVLADLEGGLGTSQKDTGHGILHEIRRAFELDAGTLQLIGAGILVYAAIEGAEAVGLWLQKRWAEYLTFIATTLFLPLEVYELVSNRSPLKILTFLLNLAVAIYLLRAKRLFGLRGGVAAEEAARRESSGWEALDRATPHPDDLRTI